MRSELLQLDGLNTPQVGEADGPLRIGGGEAAVHYHRASRSRGVVPHVAVREGLFAEEVRNLIADTFGQRGQLVVERLRPIKHEAEARRAPLAAIRHSALLEIRLREAVSPLGERLPVEAAEAEARHSERERGRHR